MGYQLATFVDRPLAPFGTCSPEQVRRSAKTGNPAVSQKITPAPKIDQRSGGGAHVVARQGDPARRQTAEGNVDATRIDPSKTVRAQPEGNGQADRRDGSRAAGRHRDRARHGATPAADHIERAVESRCVRIKVRAVPAENNRTERGAQRAVLADVGSKDAQ